MRNDSLWHYNSQKISKWVLVVPLSSSLVSAVAILLAARPNPASRPSTRKILSFDSVSRCPTATFEKHFEEKSKKVSFSSPQISGQTDSRMTKFSIIHLFSFWTLSLVSEAHLGLKIPIGLKPRLLVYAWIALLSIARQDLLPPVKWAFRRFETFH